MGTSLVVQWLRILLPIQGTQVQFLVWEDPTCSPGTWAPVPQLLSLHSGAHVLQPLKPSCSRACAPQREKPLQGEACRPQQRAAPAPCKQRKPMHSSEDPAQPKINILIFFKKSTVEGRGTAQYSLAGILASNHLFEFHEKSEVFNLGRSQVLMD